MSPRVAGNSAKEIVDIGKNATPELIRILDSKDKGIVAHFILSEIWNDKWKEEVCCYIKNMNDEEIVTINGLEIHIKNNALFSTTQSLNNNKQNWKIFWQT
jgi:hypothetical protein